MEDPLQLAKSRAQLAKRLSRSLPSRSPAERVRDGKGRRKERIRSFRRKTETEWSEFHIPPHPRGRAQRSGSAATKEELRPAAAGGRRRQGAISAAVEKREGQRARGVFRVPQGGRSWSSLRTGGSFDSAFGLAQDDTRCVFPPFSPSRSPAERVRDGKGRRKERIRSFRRKTETKWSEFLSPRLPSSRQSPAKRVCRDKGGAAEGASF